ncbi:(E)-4-hydroxy-3-methylbut-2-enyl-diphosphate synthase [Desulfosalsimonas propionicica]|uniref:4-hydroxy-3-methylbut-2-en-1-yl diphosphate synthase (flavodoxin) n=1 Tax=Desulfosalsimonas propionicica TaxID=332175 RepID=A0A7W0C6Y1_9BACT|nr:flavodoxin-dependent (E)-4-hydroxy-3-methylbut-2-enyl-diphosphate synthase [Desulfosalsimonas propionicica]MBA2880299.1 (E)-4-hydroxy-3-methylbut-2-enyl-diphosphate synthase [Desulfosalsimonas propionicica]
MPTTIKRKTTRQIHVGSVPVGGDASISVQSMTNTHTADVAATVAQIRGLEEAGCEIIRVAVPDMDAARAISEIRTQITIPLIADIHFDFRLAVAAAAAGANALRINPGNIGAKDKIRAVVAAAKDSGLSIRVGVNAGSLDKDIYQTHGGPTPAALVQSALRQVAVLAEMDFHEVKVSLKSSDVMQTIEAYELFSDQSDIPLHVGVTEAGGLYAGIVKSAMGIGSILSRGIGDTLRVSLTRDPTEEVRVGYEILKALDIRRRGPEIISCPTCGRCEIDLFSIAESVEKALLSSRAPIRVAVMGCAVNGPGEAREADVGIAGGRGTGILFKKGKVVKKFPEDRLVRELLAAVRQLEENHEP